MRTAARPLALALALALWLTGARADVVPLDEVGLRVATAGTEQYLPRGASDARAAELVGLDARTVNEAMALEGGWLMLFEGDRQTTLLVTDAPEGLAARDVSELDEAGRGAFLAALASRHAAASAVWLDGSPDWALTEAGARGAMDAGALYLETLYLGRVYGLRLEVFGRAADADDRAYLADAASRVLRLGATSAEAARRAQDGADAAPAPEPAAAPVLTAEAAPMTAEGDASLLTLEPVAAILPTNTITLAGATEPGAKLRVRVGKDTSSAFSPEEDGRFTITRRGLKNRKDNEVAVTAVKDGREASVTLTVTVDLQDAPARLSTLAGVSTGDSFTVEGATLPGASVQVSRGGSKRGAEVDENGRFAFEVPTKKPGSFAFKVTVSLAGYRDAELSGKVRRARGDGAPIKLADVDHARLVKKPADYEGEVLALEGEAAALAYEDGAPKCLVRTAEGDLYVLYMNDLLNVEAGAEIARAGVLTGALEPFAGTGEYPALRERAGQ